MGRQRWLALAAVLAMVLTACGGDSEPGSEDGAAADNGDADPGDTDSQDSDPASDDPFEVLAVLPLSGAFSSQGGIMQAGVQCAVDVVNTSGGVLGRQIEITYVDDGSDPAQSTSLLQEELARGATPELVVPGVGSAWVLAMLPQLTRESLFSVGISASAAANDPATNPYHFNLVHASYDNMAAFRPVAEDMGVDTVGVFFSNDALGETNLESLNAAFEGSDIELAVEMFDPSQIDLTASLQRLRDKDPDVIFYSTYGPSAGHVLTSRETLGWDIPVIGDAAVTASNVAELVEPAQLEGVGILSVKEAAEVPDDDRPYPDRWNEMKSCIKGEVGEIDQTLSIGSYGHQVITLAAGAAELAGSTDPAEMAQALEEFSTPMEDFEHHWVNFEDPGFTDDKHIVEAVEGDYVLVAAASLVDGLIPYEPFDPSLE